MVFMNNIAFAYLFRLKPTPTEGWLKCAEMHFYKITGAVFCENQMGRSSDK